MAAALTKAQGVVLACGLALLFIVLTAWLPVRTPSSLPAITALVVLASAAFAGLVALLVPTEVKKVAARFAAVFIGCAALLAALLAIPHQTVSRAGSDCVSIC